MKNIKLFAAAVMMILLVACSGNALIRGGGISEKFHQSYSLSPGGSVSLHNINGDVSINVWDKNEVMVDAVKYADDREELDQLIITVDASSDRVDIDTKYPENSNTHNHEGPRVEYVITVPKTASLNWIKTVNGRIEITGVNGKVNASTVNGTITASGLRNSCELKTVNGKVRADFASITSGADVNLKSVNGSLAVKLPAGTNASVKANATMGKVSNDFGLTSSSRHEKHSFVKMGDSLEGMIGNGGADIHMETVNGSIRILKSGADQ